MSAKRPPHLTGAGNLTDIIAGPIPPTRPPKIMPPRGACDCHAHIFGPSDRFPYAPGRGYTPPDTPVEMLLAMHDAIGFDRGIAVQGNAHLYDNSPILDALARAPDRLRGVCITDLRVNADDLRRWDALGVRGLRFHLHLPSDPADYVRGVGLDVLNAFLPTMRELGWHAQMWCDWRALIELEPQFRKIARDIPVVIDHMLGTDPDLGPGDPSFQCLLRMLADDACWVKLSAAYRMSDQYPDYPDARPFHEALVRTNPDRLVFATDWPHAHMLRETMPEDSHLVDLFDAWTPDPVLREKILVRNPERLYGFPPVESSAG